jgi:serine protease Do
MLNKNQNNHGHLFVKVSAALAAMAIVSATSVEMYQIFGENKNMTSAQNQTSVTTNDSTNTDTEKSATSTASSKISGASWVNLAAPSDALTIPEIVEKAMPSAVGISSTFSYTAQSSAMDYFGYNFGGMYGSSPQQQTQEVTATGSGIVMSSDGYIITNAHVIYDTESEYNMGKATSVTVVMGDNHDEEYEAEIVGYDIQTDLAVLKIDAEGLTPAEFGDSNDLEVGELVVAIGNPLGFELYGTTTCGIVSAVNREVQLEDRTMTLIQTDAAINSGNSGGMLLNAYGQVIGINSMKMGSSYGSASVEGLGFAIPISDAKEIINSLINNGYVTGRPQLGITGVTVTESDAERFNLPQGVYVYGVAENSAAAKAGLQQGDIITAIDGVEITTMEELSEQKNKHQAGDTVTLRVSRSGETMDVQMTLQEVKQED